jgi:hypothetical protein
MDNPETINVNDRNVFIFWDGPTKSIIELCRKTMIKHSNNGTSYKLHHMHMGNIRDHIYAPDTIDNFCWAHKADYFRVCLLEKYGGIWIDSDMIVLDDLSSLFGLIETQGAFFTMEDGYHLTNALFGSKPATPLLKEWKTLCTEIIESGTPREWATMGPLAVTNYRNEGKIKSSQILFGAHNVYPIQPEIAGQIFLLPKRFWTLASRQFQPVISLVHDVTDKFDGQEENSILQSDTVVAYFLSKALS